MTHRPAPLLSRCADRWCAYLRIACGALVAITTALILLNVLTRALQMALFWVDELAVYCMVWAALLGAATTVRRREAIAVGLVPPLLRPPARRALRVFGDSAVLVFAAVLTITCWLWFDPPLLLASGFDIDAFISASYNFVYRDPTHTLGIRRFWLWLVMPLTALSLSLFALANLAESLRALVKGEDA